MISIILLHTIYYLFQNANRLPPLIYFYCFSQASWTEGYSGRISTGPHSHVGPFGGYRNHDREEESGQEPKAVIMQNNDVD